MQEHQYAIILILLAATLFLTAISKKTPIPHPVFLVLAGVALGFIPHMNISLDPEIVFLIFLPPLLYDAAAHTEL